MENKKQVPSADDLYFGMQAEMGLTKHVGGKRATNELIKLCEITKGSYVLDIGCGVGKTACYLAEKIGCRVVGIDLRKGMIRNSRERAKRKTISDKVEFEVADGMNMSFNDNTFDAVICESVTAFFDDKQKGLNEYTRVVKKGGYVGINEVTWTGIPPEKIVDYVERVMGAGFLNEDGWRKLLENAGLKGISVKAYKPNALQQFMDELSWMELRDFFGPWHKVIMLFVKSREYRNYLKRIGIPPLNIANYMGNGIYIGKK